MNNNNFYEEDEPVTDIRMAFAHGISGKTRRHVSFRNRWPFGIVCMSGYRRIFCWLDNLYGPHEDDVGVFCKWHESAQQRIIRNL